MAGVKKSKKTEKKHPIVIIGGGPSGIAAAHSAVHLYNNVLLFEKNPTPGKKLTALPSNQIYITEELTLDKTARAFGPKEEFVKTALKTFGWKDLDKFLTSLGVKITTNGSSHLAVPFDSIPDFIARLKQAVESEGVVIRKSSKVSDIIIAKDRVTGVVVNAVEYPASAVIVASGSFSAPISGSTRDGYEFASQAGHTVVPLKPALVGLETVEKYGKMLYDAEFIDCKVEVLLNDVLQFSDHGNFKFTAAGLEGDLIFTHSAEIIDLLPKGKVTLHIDMIPDIAKKDLENWFNQEMAASHKAPVGVILEKYIPQKLRAVMGKIMRIHSDKPAANLSTLERKSLLLWIKDFHVTIKRPRPFNETRGVLGGVATEEIEAETMRSKKIRNLYFAGEVMDILGPWGGYNIQMAFSTGYLAGLSAAKTLCES